VKFLPFGQINKYVFIKGGKKVKKVECTISKGCELQMSEKSEYLKDKH
jgi:hypothetical protein